ncbi:hypothetical protein NP233_g2235 [Leucocoprinus birnbaumii]|uniref:ATP-dependent DNA helicase n=1 Tax=Leucocoprinus birnbaumii TaxID=56174 RepID=A0AAD5YXE1_9AGAR|nr:hypothetical protein NP233_g2235 [Leucocoprinus birnbaumii]
MARTLKSITRENIELLFSDLPTAVDEPELTPVYPTPPNTDPSSSAPTVTSTTVPLKTPSTRESLDELKHDQRLVHDIVEQQLLRRLNGIPTRQMLMLCLGEGGTGKSRVIQEITKTYEEHGAANRLSRTATSGVAATLIDGETLHSWLKVGIKGETGNEWMAAADKKKHQIRVKKIANRYLLIIDECSMLTLRMLMSVSQLADYIRSKVREGEESIGIPFGRLDVMLFGDFHQFPPIRVSGVGLYEQPRIERDILGRNVYHQFQDVITLREQMRVRDPEWLDMLQHLRRGACTARHLELIHSITLTKPQCQIPDFKTHPWDKVVLITSRCQVRDIWNIEALAQHCRTRGVRHFVASAEDTVGKKPPSIQDRVDIAKYEPKKLALSARVHLAEGMRVIVGVNIATEADIANGTRGTIVEIRLDPREPPLVENEQGRTILSYPPALILFRPDKTPRFQFGHGIPDGLVPITPTEKHFSAKVPDSHSIRVCRRQLALQPAYAFTDYKSQGQTLDSCIVDLAHPPDRGSHITPFAAYVALSRAQCRDDIRILRDFDEKIFTTLPSIALEAEDKRLAALERKTRAKYAHF